MSKNVILIAGQSGAKSTFAGGLLHHVDKTDGYNITDKIEGNQEDYNEAIIDKMFTQGEYPDQTTEGYIAHYELQGESFSRPGLEIDIVDFPGEQQDLTLNPDGDLPLLERVRDGQTDGWETIKQKYENNIRNDFRLGQTPNTRPEWETTFLYHYYQADKAIFLMNMFKITDMGDKELLYTLEDIKHASNQFSDVAVIPIAVDWLGYDPNTFNPGFVERVTNALLKPARRDKGLTSHLDKHISRGDHQQANGILNHVRGDREIDFFSVSVPDRGAPDREEGRLTPDGNGFVTKGFDEVTQWLQK